MDYLLQYVDVAARMVGYAVLVASGSMSAARLLLASLRGLNQWLTEEKLDLPQDRLWVEENTKAGVQMDSAK